MIVEEESAKGKVKNTRPKQYQCFSEDLNGTEIYTSSKKPDARLSATVKPDLAIKLEQAPAKKKSVDSSKALESAIQAHAFP